ALLTALELFSSGGFDAELAEKRQLLERIADGLKGLPVQCKLVVPSDGQSLPLLEITLEQEQSAFEVCKRLRQGKPSVQVGHLKLDDGVLMINPMHLNAERAAELTRRLREELSRK